MTKRERQILEIIKENPMISQNDIGEKLDITRSSVGVHITNLINKGHIKGRGYILTLDEYVTVIGGANVDIIGYPRDSLNEYDSNPGKINTSCGGVGRNIAENLSRLGIDTRLITAIGNDYNGELIKRNASLTDIDIVNSIIVENGRTATYLAILNRDHDMNLAISDMDIVDYISPEFIGEKRNIIENSKLTVLDTNLREDSLEYILTNIRQDYFVDTVSTVKAKKIRELLPYIHSLKPNEYEASLLSGIEIDSDEKAIEAGKALIAKGVKRVFLTRGDKGLVYFDKDRVIRVESSPLKVENATGAGDAFIAGLAFSQYMDYSIEDTLYTAVGASRITVKDINTISDRMTLENILKEKEEIRIC